MHVVFLPQRFRVYRTIVIDYVRVHVVIAQGYLQLTQFGAHPNTACVVGNKLISGSHPETS